MKKLTAITLCFCFFLLTACGIEPKPKAPEKLTDDFAAHLRISASGRDYDAEFFGSGKEGSRMKILSPYSLSFLEFELKNSEIICGYGDMSISNEHSDIPLKNIFKILLEALSVIGSEEYEVENGHIKYGFSNGYSIYADPAAGKPSTLNANGITVDFAYE